MRRAAPAILCLLLLLAPASAVAEQEELAAAPGRIVADAYGGRIAWAQLDPSTGLWELVEFRDGKVRLLRGAGASKEPVRLDLGPGPDGKPVAVYARGGKLYLYDFAKRKERHLVEFGTGSLPSIWRGQMVFARRENGVSSLWLGKLGTGRLAKLPGGPVNGPSGPVATELRGSRVVYVWSSRKDGFIEVELYEVRGNRAIKRDRTGSGGHSTSTFVTPEIAGSTVYYGRATYGRPGQELRRVSLRTGRVEYVRAPFGPLVSAQWTRGGRFLLSRTDEDDRESYVGECRMKGEKPLSDSICRLIRTDPVSGWASIRSRVAH